MGWTSIRIVSRLARLDTCALIFIAAFLPTYCHSRDLVLALTQTVPLLPVCMCGFILNDLRDIEKDRENHPHRPLPCSQISEWAASLGYFCLLALALILFKLYLDSTTLYLYMLLLLMFVNYNYVIDYVPITKNIYVASAGLVLIALLSSLTSRVNLSIIAPATFLFLLGREMLMDIQDSKGDENTLAKHIGVRVSENFAFASKFFGSLLLFLTATNALDTILVSLILVGDCLFLYLWKANAYRRLTVNAMKFQLLIGIYFLVRDA
jgi:geranylgeranylglycerol-phosphate geranylgeranyltransferase